VQIPKGMAPKITTEIFS